MDADDAARLTVTAQEVRPGDTVHTEVGDSFTVGRVSRIDVIEDLACALSLYVLVPEGPARLVRMTRLLAVVAPAYRPNDALEVSRS